MDRETKEKKVTDLTVAELMDILEEYMKTHSIEPKTKEKAEIIRRKIFDYILDHENKVTPKDIQKKYGLTYDMARHHLNILLKNDRLILIKEDNNIYYSRKL